MSCTPTLRTVFVPLLALAALAPTACMKAPDPAQAQRRDGGAPVAPPIETEQPAPSSTEKPTIEMEVPDGWTEAEANMAFYLAKWDLGDADGGNCTVSWNVGDAESNLERWKGQFAVPDDNWREAMMIGRIDGANYPTAIVEILGTMTATRSLGGGEPREEWMLLGAILESPFGPIFVKAVGPQEVLAPLRDQFRVMVSHAKLHS